MRQGIASAVTGRMGWIATGALACSMLFGALGCESNRTKLTKEQSEQGLGLSDASSDRRPISIDPRCELNEEVVDPAEKSPEWVIQQLLEASSSPKDDEASFQKFFSHFDETKSESWVRQQYWPRARQHVDKYLLRPAGEGVVYKICDRRPTGDSKVKIFIQSNDPKKSNPPITLDKDAEGVWKVSFYSY
ncbi:MAG: hypothetical protein KC635_28605 [Myxococcales bacterium]|nr:hypothetical protein [Myxococcales bacterium]MCB9733495.1 hypothetical protein [Deltaproteobacteria bacterium]